jgi:putative lipoic acid-binding regulatory protein
LAQTQPQSDDFYSRFYDQLLESQVWPGVYLFKFIVKAESDHLNTLKSYFDNDEPQFSEKQSSKKTFTSLSVKVKMETPDSVIQIYKKASTLEELLPSNFNKKQQNSIEFTILQSLYTSLPH